MATAQRDAKPVTFGVTILCRWLPVNNRNQHLEQIEKLLTSRTLHGSESLCKLLRYLADHSVDHPGASPKEYQIATEVFGRQQDFDPHVDSMVRVQAGRLRTKLAEYYASEGSETKPTLNCPKATTALTFIPPQNGPHANTPLLPNKQRGNRKAMAG